MYTCLRLLCVAAAVTATSLAANAAVILTGEIVEFTGPGVYSADILVQQVDHRGVLL